MLMDAAKSNPSWIGLVRKDFIITPPNAGIVVSFWRGVKVNRRISEMYFWHPTPRDVSTKVGNGIGGYRRTASLVFYIKTQSVREHDKRTLENSQNRTNKPIGFHAEKPTRR